jgi:hypothetical protein
VRVKQLGTIDEKQEKLTLLLPTAKLELDAKGLEQLIVDLIGFRQSLLPRVTAMPNQDEIVPVLRDPPWLLAPSVDGTQLSVFYFGLGWLHYVISREKIGDWATALHRANSQPPDPPASQH